MVVSRLGSTLGACFLGLVTEDAVDVERVVALQRTCFFEAAMTTLFHRPAPKRRLRDREV